MEFKIGDKKIVDTKRYGLFGKNVMVITLDAFSKKSLVLRHSERMRAFVLYLIGQIQKESKKNKVTECESYRVLDNYLNLLNIQIDLLAGDSSIEWSKQIVTFTGRLIKKAQKKGLSKEEDDKALREGAMIEDNMIIK